MPLLGTSKIPSEDFGLADSLARPAGHHARSLIERPKSGIPNSKFSQRGGEEMEPMGIREVGSVAEQVKQHLLEELPQLLIERGVRIGEMLHVEVRAVESEIHNAAWQIAKRLIEACNTSEMVARRRGTSINREGLQEAGRFP